MRSRACRACQDFHPIDEPWPAACAGHFASRGPASDLAAPMLIRDGMAPIVSMADGKTYDSKRAYERGVRRAGCVIVGNEKAPFAGKREYAPKGVGDSIKQTIEQLEARS